MPRTAILLLVSLFAAACGNANNATPTPNPAGADVSGASQPIERLLAAQHGGPQAPTEQVIRDRAAFARAWAALHADAPAAPLPSVDFARQMVLVVGLGERTTGGHAVRVDAVAAEGTGAVVRYTTSAPGADCMTTQVITSPVEVVSVPRVAGEVRFERRQATTSC